MNKTLKQQIRDIIRKDSATQFNIRIFNVDQLAFLSMLERIELSSTSKGLFLVGFAGNVRVRAACMFHSPRSAFRALLSRMENFLESGDTDLMAYFPNCMRGQKSYQSFVDFFVNLGDHDINHDFIQAIQDALDDAGGDDVDTVEAASQQVSAEDEDQAGSVSGRVQEQSDGFGEVVAHMDPSDSQILDD